jgi:SAM-dependent methyltransferase
MSNDRPGPSDDPFSRVDYRRMVAWPQRLRREAPFLREILAKAPEKSVLDLGCGTGEHSRFFAEEGCRVVGLDRSESMIQKATEDPMPPNLSFILGDIVDMGPALRPKETAPAATEPFGLALSLGNTLVNVTVEEDMKKALRSLNGELCIGGLFLLQILNYERILEKKIRHLPLNFREDDEGETIFLRLMEDAGGGYVRFCPTTLTYRPDNDPPVEVVQSRAVMVRGWKHPEMTLFLEESGFELDAVWGNMERGPYDPQASPDLVILARKVRTLG